MHLPKRKSARRMSQHRHCAPSLSSATSQQTANSMCAAYWLRKWQLSAGGQSKKCMALEADPKAAVFYVVDNPAAPESQELALLACMQGGYMVSPEWLCSRGRQGLAAAVVQATHTARRKLWVSHAFKTNNPQLAAAVTSRIIETGGSKWRLCKRADWLNAAVKATPSWGTIALVTTTEMAALGIRTALDPASFLARYFRLDAEHCTMRA